MSALYENYFDHRQAGTPVEVEKPLPPYLASHLPADRQARILDIGCGHGEVIRALQRQGYTNVQGVDVSPDAVLECQKLGLNVSRIDAIEDLRPASGAYEFVIMTHVLEHLPKAQVVATLKHIRTVLLTETGSYYVAVPNAQSNTGCYWAYEDFTHETLFTAGSLYFVLKCAGFKDVEFLDADGLANASGWKRAVRRFLLGLYRRNIVFWNRVTASSYHAPSPVIFTFELKAVAKGIA